MRRLPSLRAAVALALLIVPGSPGNAGVGDPAATFRAEVEPILAQVAERRCRVLCPIGPGAAGDEEQGEGDRRGQRMESSHDRFPGGREETTGDRRPDAGRPSPSILPRLRSAPVDQEALRTS